MKGLRRYIKKHGRHFTEELAHEVTNSKWSSEELERTAQSKVYYNVTGSTIGDIVYLVNIVHKAYPEEYAMKNCCVNYALAIIGDVKYTGHAFSIWLQLTDDFDFTPYI